MNRWHGLIGCLGAAGAALLYLSIVADAIAGERARRPSLPPPEPDEPPDDALAPDEDLIIPKPADG